MNSLKTLQNSGINLNMHKNIWPVYPVEYYPACKENIEDTYV